MLVSIVGGLLITALFVIRQLRSSEPLLNLKVFSSRVFTMTTIVNIAVTILMYADLILLPLYLQNGRALTAFTAGLILLPGSIVNAVLSPIAGKLYDRIGAKPLFLAGTALIGISMLAVVDLSSTTSIPYLIIRTIVLRIGLTCITMPLNTAALNALPRELVAHGSAVNNTIRQIAGAVGTAVIVTIYTTQLTGAIASADEAPMAAAAGNTYIYMLVIACLAFIICWFTPKKQKSPAA